MIRVLVVDDHPIVRDGLTAVVECEDITVVASVGTAEEGLVLLAVKMPDVVLLDLELPGMRGIEAIRHFSKGDHPARVIIFTAFEDEERVFGALDAGARGYLLKGVPGADIVRAIRSVHAGDCYLEPRIAARVVGRLDPHRPTLSARERQVLAQAAEGHSNKQIAYHLGISERTVKFHLTQAFNKLGAENRAQAVAMAIRNGMLKATSKFD